MPELIENLLSTDEANDAFNALRPEGNEVNYGQYYAMTDNASLVRLPRLMAFQATMNESGDFPWYRCTMSSVPQNKIVYTLWTPTIQKVKDSIEQKTGETWNLAHVIYYRDGDDSMGMHSDTMLDLAPGSKIAVVSFGATRQLELLKKRQSTMDGPSNMKFDLPGNSLFLLDEETNKHYVHGIRKKKKHDVEDRIAIVFRHVTTFKTDDDKFYGYGSAFLTKQDIVQQKVQQEIVHYLLSVILTALMVFFSPILTTHWWQKLVISGFTWYLLYIAVKRTDRSVRDYRNNKNNERLQELCRMKNFKIWDQTDMRKFLKYS
ncbi:unnamed protein product [Adineta ricciae]|uniref:Fe2OG dioxygenase domain-containing protein n=2 Tax=Adineta ricciae TaxID=249248 RepID=A0A814WGJ1_ADIRI|nr:unnamed protein product [Adineta ricciae]